MELDEFYDKQAKRMAFQNLFIRHADGPLVLAIIRNELGVNEYAPGAIRPELIAFDHWLMHMIGVKHSQNAIDETKALLTAANDKDIDADRRRIQEAQRAKTEY